MQCANNNNIYAIRQPKRKSQKKEKKKTIHQKNAWNEILYNISLFIIIVSIQLLNNIVSSQDVNNNNNNIGMTSSAYEVILSNNRVFPLVGVGAGNIEHRSIPIIIHEALSKSKIRLVDTSRSSSNEALVARAILRYLKNRNFSDKDNNDEEDEIVIHVLTKVWYTHLGYERTNLSVRESLNDLSSIISSTSNNNNNNNKKWIVKVHVLLQYPYCNPDIKWMNCEEEEEKLSEHVKNIGGSNPLLDKENAWRGSWRALEEMYTAGILESIGVSNFNIDEMNTLLDIANVKPHIYQGSMSSIMYDKPLMELLSKHNVFVQAFNIFKDTLSYKEHANHAYGVLQRVGMTYEKNNNKLVYPPSSVIMSYLLQHGYGIVPGTTDTNHLKYNAPQYLISSFPKLSARHDMDVENAISILLQIASSSSLSNNNSDLNNDNNQITTTTNRQEFIQYDHPEIGQNISNNDNTNQFIPSNQGVITTFFNGLSSKSIKLFLISSADDDTNGYPIPVTIWMDPGKSKRVLANPNDVYVAYDGHGNAIKKFWISQDNGGEETFSIEL